MRKTWGKRKKKEKRLKVRKGGRYRDWRGDVAPPAGSSIQGGKGGRSAVPSDDKGGKRPRRVSGSSAKKGRGGPHWVSTKLSRV